MLNIPYQKKIGETEYRIGWLPLGGYVKISGMIDEHGQRTNGTTATINFVLNQLGNV
jgi:membrane-associated protease RseP (regulator of RpoE activity)